MKLTYCNPLSIADIPHGTPLDYSLSKLPPLGDYRSISDPSVVYHEGKWILYPSYKVAYVTEDFVHWKHVDIGVPHMRYSPAITQFRGKWYLGGHGMSELYCADEPTGPFGAKSIGEIVINTPAPAIAHAIYRATGKWFRELPITPEQIAMSLAD